MGWETSFEEYRGHSNEAVRHSDRRCRLISYCGGRMLPIQHNDVNPLVSHLEPQRVVVRHKVLHHFVSRSPWSN
uniref:Uncharacterized protein n=1 Tax=Mycetohabitans sp. TaxID=2571162 RepID=A0A6B9HD41_9BURK|nr:hypothetical protein [Mycetohabitans sp.]